MTIDTYKRLSEDLLAAAASIEEAKRAGYTMGSEDVLANFKRIAERTGLTPLQVWAVYFLKHVDAITSYTTRPDLPVSEAMEGRVCDAINYLKLGWGLIQEGQPTTRQEPQPESLTAAMQRAGWAPYASQPYDPSQAKSPGR
jgi:hypothetical protein